MNDLRGRAVLITGGTMGIGLATGLAFGRQGAHVFLTHRWGSADEDEVRARFAEAGAPAPAIVEADASQPKETTALLERIGADHGEVFAFVSGVCVVPICAGPHDLSRRALSKSLEYSTWPLVDTVQQIHQRFGSYPRYVVGLSSDGPDRFYPGYEYVAVSKAAMEVLGRYLATRLYDEGVRVHMVRTRNVLTESALTVHGADYPDFVRRYAGERHFVPAEEVGSAVLALCSGLLDACSGQVLTVDRGGAFQDNLMYLFRHRDRLGLGGEP